MRYELGIVDIHLLSPLSSLVSGFEVQVRYRTNCLSLAFEIRVLLSVLHCTVCSAVRLDCDWGVFGWGHHHAVRLQTR